MIIFSDVHLDEDSAEVVLGRVLPGIFKAAIERKNDLRSGTNDVAMTGDFWHLRYRVDVRLQNAVRDEFLRWVAAGIRLYILPGNHDQVDVHGRHAMEVFDGLGGMYGGHGGGCKVFHEPTWTTHGLWVPYRKRNEQLLQALATPPPGPRDYPPVVFGHFGVLGAYMNDHIQDEDGLPIGAFHQFNFKRVVLGHYHKRQSFRDGELLAWYVGSPWQVSANEAGQAKGYAIWDREKLTWVDTEWGPRFHRFELGKGEKLDLSGIKAGDEVRVAVASGVDPEKIGKQLAALGVKHAVTPAVEALQARLEVGANASVKQYAGAYVAAQETPLDRGRLMQVFEEISR